MAIPDIFVPILWMFKYLEPELPREIIWEIIKYTCRERVFRDCHGISTYYIDNEFYVREYYSNNYICFELVPLFDEITEFRCHNFCKYWSKKIESEKIESEKNKLGKKGHLNRCIFTVHMIQCGIALIIDNLNCAKNMYIPPYITNINKIDMKGSIIKTKMILIDSNIHHIYQYAFIYSFKKYYANIYKLYNRYEYDSDEIADHYSNVRKQYQV